MKPRHYVPLVGFVVPTVLIGYGVVIPRSCIAGINDLTGVEYPYSPAWAGAPGWLPYFGPVMNGNFMASSSVKTAPTAITASGLARPMRGGAAVALSSMAPLLMHVKFSVII